MRECVLWWLCTPAGKARGRKQNANPKRSPMHPSSRGRKCPVTLHTSKVPLVVRRYGAIVVLLSSSVEIGSTGYGVEG